MPVAAGARPARLMQLPVRKAPKIRTDLKFKNLFNVPISKK